MTSVARSVARRVGVTVAPAERDLAWTIAVWAAMGAWSVASYAVVRSQFADFQLGRFDLGNMVQAVWSTTQGRPLEATTVAGEQLERLGGHVDPILVVLAPLWAVAPSPLTLALAQIVAASLGALPVHWLARKHLGSEWAAGLLALAYLASPWLAWNAQDAIHPKTLAIPLFLYAVWFLDSDRLWAFAAVAVPAAACGELMGLTIAALGIWYALARRRTRAGAVVAALGVGWSATALFVVIPAFSGEHSVYYGLYDSVGGSPVGIVRTAFTDPGAIAAALVGRDEILYVVLLAMPLAGLFVLSPGLALVGLPQLGVNLLADATGPTDPRHHYVAGIVPFLVAATAIGLARLPASRRASAAGLVLGLSVFLSAVLGPWGGLTDPVPLRYDLEAPAGHADVLRRAVSLVPDDAAVTASNKAGSHLSARRYHFTLPVLRGPESTAEWIVLDMHDPWIAYGDYPFLVERPVSDLEAFRARVQGDGSWEVVFEEGGVYVFRRAAR